jgi:hypothetical protein
MNFDEMLETWRAQDETPPYRVNPDLLQVVVQQEQAGLRREMGLGNSWAVPWALWFAASALLAVAVAGLFVMASIGKVTPTAWDYVATGIAIGAMLVWPGAYWASCKRHPPRGRGFGNSLKEEIQRNLSWVDYELSRYGRFAPSLLRSAPMWVAVSMFFWISVRMNDEPFGWLFFFSVAWPVLLPLFWTGHYQKKQLLAYRRRLSELLELLNASEWKANKWEASE